MCSLVSERKRTAIFRELVLKAHEESYDPIDGTRGLNQHPPLFVFNLGIFAEVRGKNLSIGANRSEKLRNKTNGSNSDLNCVNLPFAIILSIQHSNEKKNACFQMFWDFE